MLEMPEKNPVNASTPLVSNSGKGGPCKRSWILGAVGVFAVGIILIASLGGSSAGENEDDLVVQMMTTPDIYCNDGTTPGFYFHASESGSDEWVVLLPGGFFCYSNESCYERSVSDQLKDFMTGPEEGASKTGEGIMSTDAVNNPYFSQANLVEIKYCSSDCYFGDKEYDESAGLYSEHLYMHGGKMVTALFTELIEGYGMDAASRVYIAGESVGGIALLGRFDEFVAQLRTEISEQLEVVGISSAGWYLYDRVFEDFDIPPTVVLNELLDFGNSGNYADASCVSSGIDVLLCFFGTSLSAYIEESDALYTIQNMFDNSHAAAEGFMDLLSEPASAITDPFPFEDAELYFAQIPANTSAYFVPDCRCHDLISTNDFALVSIDGITLAESVVQFADYRHDEGADTARWQLRDSDPSCLECNSVCGTLECWQE